MPGLAGKTTCTFGDTEVKDKCADKVNDKMNCCATSSADSLFFFFSYGKEVISRLLLLVNSAKAITQERYSTV